MPQFVYLAYDGNGVPLDINKDPDDAQNSLKHTITSRNRSEVQYKFPNGKPLPSQHPNWLKDADVHVVEDNVEMQVVYIDEGAGYRNTFGYFVYDTLSPPASVNDIAEIRIVFANASGQYKGGALQPGDTLKLPYTGTVSGSTFTPTSYVFPAGKSVGWVLLANGWNGSSVNTSKPTYFSRSSLNPEGTEAKRHHTIAVLADTMDDTILYGFEDLPRESWSDDDFNDFLFFVEANPLAGISDTSYNQPDLLELYGTIICNDEQDFSGAHNDCDYNDVVASYYVDIERTSLNEVVGIDLFFHFKHRGSWYDHEFGLTVLGLNAIPAGYATVYKETFIGDSTTGIFEDISAQVIGAANPNNRLPVCTSTKTLLPENPHCTGFCNTHGEWYTAENKVPASSVRIRFTFAGPLPKSQFDTQDELVIPYIKVWRSGTAGVEPENVHERSRTDELDTPPMIASSGIAKMRPIYVLGNCTEYRPCLEKHSVHHVYHRFTEYVASDEILSPTWWDGFREEQYAVEAMPDPQRAWNAAFGDP